MFEHIEKLIQRHASGGVLVDTNLLILHLVGQTRPDLIGQFQHTKEYSPEDFRMLSRLHFSVSVSKFEERTCSIQRSVGNAYFTRLGFTNASICGIAGSDSLVLTADFPLANVFEFLGVPVINFSHIRRLG